MANLQVKDGAGSDKYLKASGAGTNGDPNIPEHLETNSAAVVTALGTLLTTGTPITGQTLESGGAGGLGWLSSVRKKLSDLIALLPTALGTTTASGSLPVTLASDGTFATLAGAVTETAPASDTASSGHNGRLQRIAQRLTSILAKLPALGTAGTASSDVITVQGIASMTAIKVDGSAVTQPVSGTVTAAASENHVGEIGGNLVSVATEFTRPADTTAYAANDVVSDSTSATTVQALANAARVSGSSGYIVGIKVSTDKKSITPRFRVHFFGTNGATLAADNVAYKESYSDGSKRLFYYDMPAMTTAADTTNSDVSRSIDTSMRIPYICAATSLYYVLETLDAFTPANGEKFTVTVYLDRN